MSLFFCPPVSMLCLLSYVYVLSPSIVYDLSPSTVYCIFCLPFSVWIQPPLLRLCSVSSPLSMICLPSLSIFCLLPIGYDLSPYSVYILSLLLCLWSVSLLCLYSVSSPLSIFCLCSVYVLSSFLSLYSLSLPFIFSVFVFLLPFSSLSYFSISLSPCLRFSMFLPFPVSLFLGFFYSRSPSFLFVL